jgi:cohesin complex subunit SA-1/2
MTELINLVIRSAGCKIEVSQDDINDPDNCATRLQDIQEEFQAVSIDH